ncbi:MAG: hypothetical protein PUA63_09300 [Oscillospiraceae bacterium]|nr:hypothetical protein [Oscillospiraceae bacterium]
MNIAVRSPFRPLSSRRAELAEKVFGFAVVLLLVLSEVFSSNIQSTLPNFSQICRLALTAVSAALLLFKCLFLTEWQSRTQIIAALAAILYSGAVFVYGGDQWFFLSVLVGISAKDVDLRRVLKIYLITAAVCVVSVQVLHYTTDLIPFNYYCRNWDFGYGHYNGYGARLIGIFFAWGWLRWPRLRWWDWAGLTALAAYTLLVPGCRGAGGAMVLLLLLFICQKLLPAFFESRIWHALILALAPALLCGSLAAGRLFTPEDPAATPILSKLNRLLSGRFEVWHHVFWRYPYFHPAEEGIPGWYHGDMPRTVSLFGGMVTDGDEHHAIDNTFLAIPMNKGILGAILIGGVFLFLVWRLCKAGCTGETLFIAAMLLYFLMENKAFLLSANPFILLLPAAILTPRTSPLPVVCPPPGRANRQREPLTV